MRTRGLAGSGLAGLVLAPLVVLGVEAAVAASRTYVDAASAPTVGGVAGPADGPPITLVVLGDSTGAGLGTSDVGDTVGGQLMGTLARSGHRVHLDGLAVSGARVAGLTRQVLKLAASSSDGPLVVVMLIGVNDATHLTRLPALERDLRQQLSRLNALGAHVVLATCPDVGAARNFAQPLRWLAGRRGRAVARTQERAAEGLPGVILVDLADTTGTAFRANPALLSSDLFHPSALGYALWARVLAPAVLRAAGDAISA